MVTHEPEIADYARRKIVIRDGEITPRHNGQRSDRLGGKNGKLEICS